MFMVAKGKEDTCIFAQSEREIPKIIIWRGRNKIKSTELRKEKL